MEDESVSNIRETSRSLLKLSRQFHRDEETDNHRGLEDTSITPESITSIALKLKTKSPTSLAELLTMKNGLMQHPDSIHEVLKTHGALRGLVRELTGNDVNKQVAAAACLCNLALGDGKAASSVAKSAGPYLINGLHSLTTELALTCAWCIGNIAGCGGREAALVVTQGSLPGLHCMLQREDTAEAALYALSHIAYQLNDDFMPDHLVKTVDCLCNMNLTASALELLFILSCHREFDVPLNLIQNILQNLTKNIQNHTKCIKKDNCCELVYPIRILANIKLNEDNYKLIISCLSNIGDSLKELLYSDTDNSLKSSLLWFLGNLYKCNREEMFFRYLINIKYKLV